MSFLFSFTGTTNKNLVIIIRLMRLMLLYIGSGMCVCVYFRYLVIDIIGVMYNVILQLVRMTCPTLLLIIHVLFGAISVCPQHLATYTSLFLRVVLLVFIYTPGMPQW